MATQQLTALLLALFLSFQSNAQICPPEMTATQLGCIDRWENHLLVKNENGELEKWSPFQSVRSDQEYLAISEPGVIPQGYISALQAKVACENSGKRLCREKEWLAGCQGTPSNQLHQCNEQRPSHPVIDFFQSNEAWIWSYESMNHPGINQQENTVAVTGRFNQCQSNMGTFDQVGNLHEWVADVTTNGQGIFRGGYYVDTIKNGLGCQYKTVAHGPRYHDYSTGFRCCLSY